VPNPCRHMYTVCMSFTEHIKSKFKGTTCNVLVHEIKGTTTNADIGVFTLSDWTNLTYMITAFGWCTVKPVSTLCMLGNLCAINCYTCIKINCNTWIFSPSFLQNKNQSIKQFGSQNKPNIAASMQRVKRPRRNTALGLV